MLPGGKMAAKESFVCPECQPELGPQASQEPEISTAEAYKRYTNERDAFYQQLTQALLYGSPKRPKSHPQETSPMPIASDFSPCHLCGSETTKRTVREERVAKKDEDGQAGAALETTVVKIFACGTRVTITQAGKDNRVQVGRKCLEWRPVGAAAAKREALEEDEAEEQE